MSEKKPELRFEDVTTFNFVIPKDMVEPVLGRVKECGLDPASTRALWIPILDWALLPELNEETELKAAQLLECLGSMRAQQKHVYACAYALESKPEVPVQVVIVEGGTHFQLKVKDVCFAKGRREIVAADGK